MNTQNEISQSTLKELEECISRAMSRLNAQKETDLCPYLPGKEGRLHHLAFGKLKKRHPSDLVKIIRENILNAEIPTPFAATPKQDAKAKRLVEIKFKPSHINRLVALAKTNRDEELLAMLFPHQSLSQIQQLMIEMIRAKEVDQNLWETYVNMIKDSSKRE